MPVPAWLLPVALKGVAAAAGTVGVGSAVHGATKMKKANDTIKSVHKQHEANVEKFELQNKITTRQMDRLGKLELEILHSFSDFSDVFEQIKSRPVFKEYSKNGVSLPKYSGETLKEVSYGAGVLLGALGGAGLGTAGAFAAAGATTSAVMALGTASTGTAIATLSGAALTNATLAALGGGAVAAGGGGIAAGTAVLGAATLGIGLLIGGIVFDITGGKLSSKADEAWDQMKIAEAKINETCDYLLKLRKTAKEYTNVLREVNVYYQDHFIELKRIVVEEGRVEWNLYTFEEKKIIENTVLLVGLLYNMCKVELVIKSKYKDELNIINEEEIKKSIDSADAILTEKFRENM